ncbi:MAG TPA: hemolysin family protein [Vicinamibacterales bacterium]|nr:hemolysin family protein [Vicinamibacterales bacterium]
MLVTWAVIFALILVTALYVAAEFAAVSVRRSRLRRLSEDGNVLAARLLPLIEDPRELDRYIAASQIGITLGSLVLGAYGQARLSGVVAPWLVTLGVDPEAGESTAAATVLVSLTALGVVLGELMPKSLALQYPTGVALWTSVPMRWSLRVFQPFIVLLNGSGILLLRLFGIRNAGHRHIHSPEEIELLIAESRDGGLLEPDEQVRLHRALRLGLRTAKQLMIPRARLAALSADLSFHQVLQEVTQSPYTRLPVYRETLDNVIGMIRTRDVVVHYIAEGAAGRTESLLRPIARVREEMAADRLLAFMREQRAHQALVVDAAGRTSGLVTLEDVLEDLLKPHGSP